MKASISELLAWGPVLTDGAWGSELIRQDYRKGQCLEHWNLEFPERVEAIARGYIRAGSRVILTNTFGANRYLLEKHRLANRVREINAAGVAISKKKSGRRPGGGFRFHGSQRQAVFHEAGDRG
ncbi:MAG: homocysteine S-methyltransferase family protein [Thermodesulfobacteriota bacterium]